MEEMFEFKPRVEADKASNYRYQLDVSLARRVVLPASLLTTLSLAFFSLSG